MKQPMNKSLAGILAMTIATTAVAAPLSELDTAVVHIGEAVARGDQDALAAAFSDGFAAGLTLEQAK